MSDAGNRNDSLTVNHLKDVIFWFVTPYSLAAVHQLFEGTYCLIFRSKSMPVKKPAMNYINSLVPEPTISPFSLLIIGSI
jgi:hypothetical protein